MRLHIKSTFQRQLSYTLKTIAKHQRQNVQDGSLWHKRAGSEPYDFYLSDELCNEGVLMRLMAAKSAPHLNMLLKKEGY